MEIRRRADQAREAFGAALESYRIQCGAPSVGSLVDNGNVGMSKANLSAIFNGKRLPTIDTTILLVQKMAAHAARHAPDRQAHTAQTRVEVEAWRKHWSEARTLTAAADKEARQARALSGQLAVDIVSAAEVRAGQIRQSLDLELTEKRQQAEAQVNEMAAWAEKVRSDTEAHRIRIIEAARAEVEAGRNRIAGTAEAIEHVRVEIENMQSTARVEAAKIREDAETQALDIVKQAERRAAQLSQDPQAKADFYGAQNRQAAEAAVTELLEAAQAEARRIGEEGARYAAAVRAEVAGIVEEAQGAADCQIADAERIRGEAEAAAAVLGVEAAEEAVQVRAEARRDAAAMRAEAEATLAEARTKADTMVKAAKSESERIHHESAVSAETARADADKIRGDAREEAGRKLEASGRDADKLVAMARSEAVKLRAESETTLATARKQAADVVPRHESWPSS